MPSVQTKADRGLGPAPVVGVEVANTPPVGVALEVMALTLPVGVGQLAVSEAWADEPLPPFSLVNLAVLS